MGVPVVRVERDARLGERLLLDFYVAAEGLAATINDELLAARTEAEALWIGWQDQRVQLFKPVVDDDGLVPGAGGEVAMRRADSLTPSDRYNSRLVVTKAVVLFQSRHDRAPNGGRDELF